VYDFVRGGQVNSGPAARAGTAGPDTAGADTAGADTAGPDATDRYELTDTERRAFDDRDVAGLYRLGLHPVLLNGFCRSIGVSRDEYRKVLEPFATPETLTPRWQSTSR
jgi:hypothetical protein